MYLRPFPAVLLWFAVVALVSSLMVAAETLSGASNYLIVSDQTGAFEAVQDYNQINEDVQKEIDRLRTQSDYSIVLDRLDSLWSRQTGKYCQVQDCWSIPVRQALATGRARPLTDAELNLYRTRFDVQADAISGTAPGTTPGAPSSQPTFWRQTIDQYPASTSAPEQADQLAELYYQQGDFLAAVALWNRLIADPLFPITPVFLQANDPDSAAVRDLFGPKVPRSASLQSSDGEIEARAAWSWICWYHTKANNHSGINLSSRPDWLDSSNVLDVSSKIADRFQNKYAQMRGRMAGKSVVLADFLRQSLNSKLPSRSANVFRQSDRASKSTQSYIVDSLGIWQIDSGKTVLLYKDESPEAIRGQYLPTAFIGPTERLFPFIETDGVVIARVGTPIVGQNLNRRTPDGLTNRLVCVDTNQENTVRWERLPQSPAARWTGAGLYYRGRLYALEFLSGYPSQLYLNCLDGASGELLWRRYIASGSAIAAGEKTLIGCFDPQLRGSTILVPLSKTTKAWIDPDSNSFSEANTDTDAASRLPFVIENP